MRFRSFSPLVAAIAAFVLAICLAGCSSYRHDPPRPGTVERGMASWYGEPFHGRPTASGEIYDMHGLSAAHRELPLGTEIEVTNLDNGRSVRLVVNDRGPYVRGRILDLSFGAAQKLDMVQAGLAPVEIRIVEIGGGTPGPQLATRYTVQVGAFRNRDNALAIEKELQDLGPVQITTSDGWHRVRVGDLRLEEDAEALREELVRRGYPAIVIPLR
jgi:rare lipoprotein A